MRKSSVIAALVVTGSASVTGLAGSPNAAAHPPGGDGVGNAVVEWNEAAGRAALAACIAPFDNPLHESRMYAMAMLAVMPPRALP